MMVLIENVEDFKSWLVKKLEPMCEADPNALTKYVVALVRKDKPEKDLKSVCEDQLQVFLQKETKPFVKELFDVLQSKSYTKAISDDAKAETTKEQEEAKSQAKSPIRKPRSPEPRRRYDDRRHTGRRRSPVQDNRRYHSRRGRSKSSSPRRRGRSSSPGLRKRSQRSRSPRRSRSPLRRKRSASYDRSARGRSSSVERSQEVVVEKRKERCWDYDQKGFCMKGDLCPYDHGTDALILDDVSLTTAVSQSEAVKSEDKVIPIPGLPPQHMVPQPLPLRMPFPPPPIAPMSVPPPMLRYPLPINIPPPSMPPQINNFRKRPADATITTEPGTKKPFYNNNASNFNRTLIVKKIPAILNNITKLNEHFAKFGAINNIQVKYKSQPNEALVEFAHVNSARAAMRDTGAVLNNRFIRVFWHKDEQPVRTASQPEEKVEGSVKDRLGTITKPAESPLVKAGDVKPEEDVKATFSEGTLFRTISNDIDVEAEKKKNEEAAAKLAAEKKAAKEASIEAQKKILAAREAVRQKEIQKQKQVLQKKAEIQKQKEDLMQKQVEQQKRLLAMLDSSKNLPASERAELMNTLKALTKTIDSIRNPNKNALQQKINKEKQQQNQKDILDTELDLYNTSSNGDNAMGLKRKISQLKTEAGVISTLSYQGGGGWGRGKGRGRGRGRGNLHRFIRSGANLDRRPCELRISGFHENEKDEMISHFADFGEIETFVYDKEGITCTLKYKLRQDAEQAASQGIFFKGRNLIIVWSSNLGKVPITTSVPPPVPANHSPVGVLEKEEEKSDDDEDEISVVVDPVVTYTPPQENFGYGMLEEELDEEALLAGGDLDDEDSNAVLEEQTLKN